MLPLKIPLSLQEMVVVYIGTFFPSWICLTGRPFFISASSNENEQPIRNETKSSCHRSVISCTCSINIPFRYTLYEGKSVLKSVPFLQNIGQLYDP